MTNKELQEELKKYDDDLVIFYAKGQHHAQMAEYLVPGEGVKENGILFIV